MFYNNKKGLRHIDFHNTAYIEILKWPKFMLSYLVGRDYWKKIKKKTTEHWRGRREKKMITHSIQKPLSKNIRNHAFKQHSLKQLA